MSAISAGYKQTEIGVIPVEWSAKTMGSLTSLMTNGFVGTVTNDYVDSEDGVLYVQGYNVEENGFNFHGIKRVSKAFHQKNSKSCLRAGDLLTIQTGDIGVTTIVPESLAGANCHALVISRFDQRLSDPAFYCQYFNSERGRVAFKEIETGSTMKHLNVGDMVKLFVPSPPVAQQRAIAAALSDVDALLAKLDQLIAKKRDLKHATMQQLLTGQTRLPGFSGEWEVKRLGDVVEIRKGQLITEKDAIAGEVPVIAGGKKPSYFHNQPNRIGKTITVSASGASAGFVAFFDTPIFASDCSTIGDSKQYSIEFIYFQLLLKQGLIYKAQTGGAQPHIHAVDLVPLEIGVCSYQEQAAIATVLSDMDAELAVLEVRRDKTRTLKQGMMQELLTGKIRLI
jgi:type I restriction enzyme S subunit